MHHIRQLLIIAVLVGLIQINLLPLAAQSSVKVVSYKREPSSAALKWANEQLNKMSLEQKIGQLISVGINATF